MTRLFLFVTFLFTSHAPAAYVECYIEVKIVRVVKKWSLPRNSGMHFVVEMQPERPRGTCQKMPTGKVKLDMNLYGDKIPRAKEGSRLLMSYLYTDKVTTRSVASSQKWRMVDFID